jgi:hypothetical protein
LQAEISPVKKQGETGKKKTRPKGPSTGPPNRWNSQKEIIEKMKKVKNPQKLHCKIGYPPKNREKALKANGFSLKVFQGPPKTRVNALKI